MTYLDLPPTLNSPHPNQNYSMLATHLLMHFRIHHKMLWHHFKIHHKMLWHFMVIHFRLGGVSVLYFRIHHKMLWHFSMLVVDLHHIMVDLHHKMLWHFRKFVEVNAIQSSIQSSFSMLVVEHLLIDTRIICYLLARIIWVFKVDQK